MQRQPVTSSNIKSVGLEGNTLEVEFSNGGVYQYTGETAAAHHAAMLKAESIGSYFAKNIRGNTALQSKRVEEVRS